jgi:predicted nucleotidyltransferase component of viral defense system
MERNWPKIDRIQKLVARIIATSPAGVRLLLIGGFRLRLLDASERFSVDLDYHWDGDLSKKQDELLKLCRRSIIKEVEREFGYQGSASVPTGPEFESSPARFLELRFWKDSETIEVPIEILKILCLDPPIIRTADGTIHATASEADLIESKIIAIFNRTFLQHRDLLDVFLYHAKLRPDSNKRLKQKLKKLHVASEAIQARLRDFENNFPYHAKAIQKIVEEQMGVVAAAQIGAAGGGKTILKDVTQVLGKVLA